MNYSGYKIIFKHLTWGILIKIKNFVKCLYIYYWYFGTFRIIILVYNIQNLSDILYLLGYILRFRGCKAFGTYQVGWLIEGKHRIKHNRHTNPNLVLISTIIQLGLYKKILYLFLANLSLLLSLLIFLVYLMLFFIRYGFRLILHISKLFGYSFPGLFIWTLATY